MCVWYLATDRLLLQTSHTNLAVSLANPDLVTDSFSDFFSACSLQKSDNPFHWFTIHYLTRKPKGLWQNCQQNRPPRARSNYKPFNCNNLEIRYWSWNYCDCWHQTYLYYIFCMNLSTTQQSSESAFFRGRRGYISRWAKYPTLPTWRSRVHACFSRGLH